MKFSIIPYFVTHERLVPKSYKFRHRFFWFKINLDHKENWPTKFVGINSFSLYSFYDSDHLDLGGRDARENYVLFAKENGLKEEIVEVTLYTSFRFLGYVFNPVSFVLLKDSKGKEHAIIEVGNTFNEQKPFFVHNDNFNEAGFSIKTKKYFYISPFIPHDNTMHFILKRREQDLSIFIDDYGKNEKTLRVWLKGKEVEATSLEIIKQTIIVPFLTLKTIGLIHWHALVLWLMGIRFYKKNEKQELQKGMYLWKKSKTR